MDNSIKLEQRLKALYLHDAQNRLIGINETDTHQIVPRLHILRTATHCRYRLRFDLSESIATQLIELAKTEPANPNFRQNLVHHQAYIDILEQDAAITKINSGPAYYMPEMQASNHAILIHEDNKSLLEENFSFSLEQFETRNPIAVIVKDEIAIAACFCARKTDYAAEAGVYTEEAYRKQGYGREIVRQWAVAVQQMGLQALYSTSWENLASQKLASSLGAIQYGTDVSFS